MDSVGWTWLGGTDLWGGLKIRGPFGPSLLVGGAGFLGGEPFDVFVEEDFFGAADGLADVGLGVEGGEPLFGLGEGFLHLVVTDFAASEVEGGVEGGTEGGEQGEEDGEEEDEDGGEDAVLEGEEMFVFVSVRIIGEELDSLFQQGDGDEDDCDEGDAVSDNVGPVSGGFGLLLFFHEVFSLVGDAFGEVVVAGLQEVGGVEGAVFLVFEEGAGGGEAFPLGAVKADFWNDGIDEGVGGFEAAHEFSPKTTIEPDVVVLAVLAAFFEAEGAEHEQEFDEGKEG